MTSPPPVDHPPQYDDSTQLPIPQPAAAPESVRRSSAADRARALRECCLAVPMSKLGQTAHRIYVLAESMSSQTGRFFISRPYWLQRSEFVDVSKRTFDSATKWLLDHGWIWKECDRRHQHRGSVYRLALDAPESRVAKGIAEECNSDLQRVAKRVTRVDYDNDDLIDTDIYINQSSHSSNRVTEVATACNSALATGCNSDLQRVANREIADPSPQYFRELVRLWGGPLDYQVISDVCAAGGYTDRQVMDAGAKLVSAYKGKKVSNPTQLLRKILVSTASGGYQAAPDPKPAPADDKYYKDFARRYYATGKPKIAQ